MNSPQDNKPTIVAPITSPASKQRSALRISGSQTHDLLEKLFKTKVSFQYQAKSYPLKLSLNQSTEVSIDILTLTMPERSSFTFEQVAELHYPANEVITVHLLEKIYSLGAVPAEPGEFTRRAFLNGRINLSQAGSISALIAAKSEEERQNALKVLASEHGDLLTQLKASLFTLRRNLEAIIDFPEEPDVAETTFRWKSALKELDSKLEQFSSKSLHTQIQSQFRILIMGPANAGKSSLIQALIPESLPIVSHIPGTTLDLVPYPIKIDDEQALLYDSPGLKDVENILDELSLGKLKDRLASFDAYILLSPCLEPDPTWPELPDGRPILRLQSKIDLLHTESTPQTMLGFSSIDGRGLAAIRDQISTWCKENRQPVSPWQALEKKTLHLIDERLPTIKELLGPEHHDEELAAYEIDELLDDLNALIHQEGGHEKLLDSIFKDFCIGK